MSRRGDPEELLMLLRFTAPGDMSGSPTITMPCGFSARGLPVGFQLICPRDCCCVPAMPISRRRRGTP